MNSAPAISARVFLLGCSRSGTTVLQRCLANHPRAHSFPETGFFRQLGGNRFWSSLALRGMVRGKSVRRAFGRLASVVPEMRTPRVASGAVAGTGRIVGLFVDAMDAHVAGLNKSIWVEKTPKHYQYARIIRRYVPEAFIIHVVRDGRDVVASIRDRAEKYPERFADQTAPAYGVKEWNRAVRIAWEQREEARVRVVLFDDFVTSTEGCLHELMDWMNLSYAPDMLLAQNSTRIRHSHENWKDATEDAIRPPDSKFSMVFSAEEQHWIDRHLDWETYNRLKECIHNRYAPT